MKYTWTEEVELVDGEEILDIGDVPFDPPQYEQIEQGTGNGPVTGLNRGATVGELEGNVSNQERIWGMDIEKYKVISGVFTPLTQTEVDALDAERQAEVDKQEALDQIDTDFMTAVSEPVYVDVNGVIYEFAGGFESSLKIDNARQLADNLNENDVELWDYYGDPHIFSKAEANDIAIAVGLSFRTNYSAMKHAKKDINDA